MSREVRAMLVTKRTEDLIIIWETGINNKSLGERSRVINDIQQKKREIIYNQPWGGNYHSPILLFHKTKVKKKN